MVHEDILAGTEDEDPDTVLVLVVVVIVSGEQTVFRCASSVALISIELIATLSLLEHSSLLNGGKFGSISVVYPLQDTGTHV